MCARMHRESRSELVAAEDELLACNVGALACFSDGQVIPVGRVDLLNVEF